MNPTEVEHVLNRTVGILEHEARSGDRAYLDPRAFEGKVLGALRQIAGVEAEPTHHPHAFPDHKINGFGIEVKHTKKDSWMSVGNSIFEGMRDPEVEDVYVIFGKMGGYPEVRWKKYDDCITHVRISHAPRFVVDMEAPSRLFTTIGIPYTDFSKLSAEDKMRHVREYARGRLRPGERLWWLEDQEEPEHTLDIQVRLYMRLEPEEKLQLRAESALLCPQIVGPSRAKRSKYEAVAMYLLTQHGVIAPQTKDLFSAGSVALRQSQIRGGNYVRRSLQDSDIQGLMRAAAEYLENALFVEYWGHSCPPDKRIEEWLRQADEHAKDLKPAVRWKPSDHLFLNR